MLSKKTLQNLFGFIVSVALIVWLYFSIAWGEVSSHLLSVNYWIIIPATFVFIIHFYLRALRWRYLLPKTQYQVGTSTLYDCIMIGNFTSYILPLRAGEFIRPYCLSKVSPHTFAGSFASVVIERFFDLSVVLLSFAFILSRVEGLPEWVKQGALALGILAVGILLFIILGSFIPEQILKICERLLFFLPAGLKGKTNKFLGDLLIGAAVVKDFYNLMRIIFLSLLVWLSCYYLFYVFLFMFSFEFTFLMAVTVAVVVALAVAAPSAPGFIGVYQTACIAGFHIFAVSKELAVTYSIITHLLNYILFALFALIFFLRNDLKLKTIMQSKNEELTSPDKA